MLGVTEPPFKENLTKTGTVTLFFVLPLWPVTIRLKLQTDAVDDAGVLYGYYKHHHWFVL